jgi:hypothetical protein
LARIDNQFLPCCAAVLGPSGGADAEVKLAESLGIPVFNDIDKLAEFFKQRERQERTLGMGIPTEKVVERSVDNVQKIYAVIIALAISQAIQNLLKSPGSTTVDLSLKQVSAGLPAFIAFLATLVPFWQGMNRHLDRCYLEKTAGVRQRVLLPRFRGLLDHLPLRAGWSIKSDIQTFLACRVA